MKVILFAAIALLIASPAQAGRLFPPANIGNNVEIACPNGQVLRWMGDRVNCVDPTDGVTVTCPNGYVLRGIRYGQPDCVAMTACSSTTSNSTSSSSATATSSATSSSGSASASASASAKSGSTGTTQTSTTGTIRSWR